GGLPVVRPHRLPRLVAAEAPQRPRAEHERQRQRRAVADAGVRRAAAASPDEPPEPELPLPAAPRGEGAEAGAGVGVARGALEVDGAEADARHAAEAEGGVEVDHAWPALRWS